MVPYKFAQKADIEKIKTAEHFYALNIEGKHTRHISQLQDWCITYLGDVEGKAYTYKDVVCALPDELHKLAVFCDKNKEISKALNGDYVINNLYENMRKEAQEYLFKVLETSVCPYCNRNYTYVDRRIRACEFDHYYPKSRYPLLAASFFNLIPACSTCNRLKGDKEIRFYPHICYPYNKLPHFKVWLKEVNYLNNAEAIDISIDGKEFIEEIVRLKLETLYKSHRDVAQEVLLLKYVYSDKYLEELAQNFSDCGISAQRLKKLFFDIPSSPDCFETKPFSKMRYEIWNDYDGTELD